MIECVCPGLWEIFARAVFLWEVALVKCDNRAGFAGLARVKAARSMDKFGKPKLIDENDLVGMMRGDISH